MDLVNPAIQYDWRCSEKPFLPNRHSLLVWAPSFNAAHYIACGSATYAILRAPRHDSGQRVILHQVPHQIITACRYLYSAFECGTGEASLDSCRGRVDMRSIDQHEPVAAAGGAKAYEAERGAPALSAADRDARHRADHVFETRDVRPGPIGLVGKC